jgi:hypothetical protein
VTALCRYRGTEPTITRELLDAACASYFLEESKAASLPSPRRNRKAAPAVAEHQPQS